MPQRMWPGEVLTGGGGFYADSGNLINPSHGTANTVDNTWEVAVFNPGPGSMGIEPIAECAQLVDVP